MSKESSFDIVSEIVANEVDNALDQSKREALNRYDLKLAKCVIDYDKNEGQISLTADNELALKNLVDVVFSKLIHRGIDVKALHFGKIETVSGGRVKQTGSLVQGISTEIGREINKKIKQSGLKVAVQIQGDSLRISSKSKDILQSAINLIKENDFGIPLQFNNFR